MMWRKSVAELRAGLRQREFSAVELAQAFSERSSRLQKQLNAFVTLTPDRALQQAEAADQLLADGQAPDLCGIPFAAKDNFCTSGIATTCGSRILADFVPPYESTVTRRVFDAGASLIGKTNMDEFAMGSSCEHSHVSATRNPWDLERVPGGSSGGSAAAVAAGLVPFALGSDTGGSIRQPASFCGITGIKPSYGRVSRYGLVAYASSLDQAGVMGRSAEDCAWLLKAMAGFDPRDSTSLEEQVEDYPALLEQDISGLRIGLPVEYWQGVDEGVAASVMEVSRELEQMGASVSDVSLSHADLAVSAYYIIAQAECSSNLSRYDGVRYGHRCEQPRDLADLYSRSRSEGFGAETKRRILVGTYALSTGYYDAYYGKAMRARRLIADDLNQALESFDFLLAPTAPTVAYGIGEKEQDPIDMYKGDVNTVAINLAGLPAIAVPGPLSEGLPVGAQLIGPYLSEARLLAVAHGLQQRTDWHQLCPEVA